MYTPLNQFHIVKLGYKEVFIFVLFLNQNIDCGYLLEPPQRAGSNVFSQSHFHMKFSIFTAFENLCILHGPVSKNVSTLRKHAHVI